MHDELLIEEKVVRWAEAHGFLTPKVRFAQRGWPDRLFLSPGGHTIFIEFKKPGGMLDPLQGYRIRELQRRGIPAYCCDNVVTAIRILQTALEPTGELVGPSDGDRVSSVVRLTPERRVPVSSEPEASSSSSSNSRSTPEGDVR